MATIFSGLLNSCQVAVGGNGTYTTGASETLVGFAFGSGVTVSVGTSNFVVGGAAGTMTAFFVGPGASTTISGSSGVYFIRSTPTQINAL